VSARLPRFLFFVLTLWAGGVPSPAQKLPNGLPFPNGSGFARTYSTSGDVDMSGPFFQALGTNGRACVTCHQPSDAWSVAAEHIAARFESSDGQDPIFRTNDGSVCDHSIDTSTQAGRRAAYLLLRTRGLFRISLPAPQGAEFEVLGVTNPYGCNETDTISVYRRPLPATNLRFLSAVMWDGRESTLPSTQPITYATNPHDLLTDLAHQSMDATMGHAQGAAPTGQQQADIVAFETALSSAQWIGSRAGSLDRSGAHGGPEALASQPFFIGVNDPLNQNPTHAPFTSVIFDLFDGWKNTGDPARASIARGQEIFNSKPITISGVAGLNDVTGQSQIAGTCGICHDTPNVGNHSVPTPLNIGVSDLTNPLGTGYLPVITLRNISTGEIARTTDPGRALISGKWSDIGKVKGPVLRGLAARAPYFHNGSAATLEDVVKFYDLRFGIGFTAQEKADLAAFLSAL